MLVVLTTLRLVELAPERIVGRWRSRRLGWPWAGWLGSAHLSTQL